MMFKFLNVEKSSSFNEIGTNRILRETRLAIRGIADMIDFRGGFLGGAPDSG